MSSKSQQMIIQIQFTPHCVVDCRIFFAPGLGRNLAGQPPSGGRVYWRRAYSPGPVVYSSRYIHRRLYSGIFHPLGPPLHYPRSDVCSEKTVKFITITDEQNICGTTILITVSLRLSIFLLPFVSLSLPSNSFSHFDILVCRPSPQLYCTVFFLISFFYTI